MAHNHHPKKIAADTATTMIFGGVLFFLFAPTLLYGLAYAIGGLGDAVRAVLGP